MKRPIVVDANDLLNSALQLDARSDPMFVAQELRALVAAAKPAEDPELMADMTQEIRYFGQCRGRVHADRSKPCDCRFCRITKRIAS